MSETFDVLYKSLEGRFLKLQQWALELKNENVQLKKQVEDENERIAQMQLQLKECEEKYKLLKEAGVVSMIEKKDVDQTRQRINSLVREIDECIALITQE